METYTPTDVIDACLDQDTIRLQHAIDALMKERVAEVLASEKIDVAKKFFNQER